METTVWKLGGTAFTKGAFVLSLAKSMLHRVFIAAMMLPAAAFSQSKTPAFQWPEGKHLAVSLSFDDARYSQVEKGTALLDKYGVKATFYVRPAAMRERLDGWKKAVTSGHEIGNHSLVHPCTGNFAWSRENAVEGYTLEKMRAELVESNRQIEQSLGVTPKVFAYPCGQTFVGRGAKTKSYVPLVAELFLTGRGWLDEGPNDPSFCDFAQLTGMEMDGKDFPEILEIIGRAKSSQSWLVLAGHEMGESGAQTTRLSMLKQLIEYAKDPANGIWLAPVGTVAEYVKAHRKEPVSN
jgi:peptidoglycan/xylan/chitin deacetylase (PgdA/CDA1 family)